MKHRTVGRIVGVVTTITALLALNVGVADAHCPHDSITDIALSPAFDTDRTVFAISRQRLMRSTNMGTTWGEVVAGFDQPDVTHIAAAPSDRNVMYASVTNGGVYRSGNGGRSWARTASRPGGSTQLAELVVSFTSSNVVFAALSTNGLYRTTDGGAHWSAVGSLGTVTALTIARSSNDVIAGTSIGVVARSRDNGATWTAATGLPGNDPITAVTAAPEGAMVYAGTRSGLLFRSADRGSSFSKVGNGLPDDPVTSIAASNGFTTDRTMWVATWHSGVYRSTDRGLRFVRTSKGLTTDVQADEYGVPHFERVRVGIGPSGGQMLYVAGFDGLFRSSDGGNKWYARETLTEYVTGVAVSPNYARDATVIATTYVKGAYISHDRGATWNGSFTGLSGAPGTDFSSLQRLESVAFSPNYANDGTIFVSTTSSIFRSTNRGTSWSETRVSPQSGKGRWTFAVSPGFATDRTVFVGSESGEIWRSQSGGAVNSWSLLVNFGSNVRAIALSPTFATDRVMYASTRLGLFMSTDAGARWTRTGPSGTSLPAISPNYATDRTAFAGYEHGLYVTRDAGVTWSELNAPPLSTASRVEALAVSPDFRNDGTLLVSIAGAGLFRSVDRGTSFAATGASLLSQSILLADFDAPASQPIQFSPAYATDRTVFGFGQTHTVRSTDGGTSWQLVDLPPAAAVIGL